MPTAQRLTSMILGERGVLSYASERSAANAPHPCLANLGDRASAVVDAERAWRTKLRE